MADTDLKIKISAEDDSGSTFSGLEAKLGKLGNAAGVAAKVIGTTLVAAAGALSVFAVASFRAATDAETEMQQATLALQNTFDNFTSKDVARMKKEMTDGQASFENLTAAMNKSAAAALKLGYDDESASKAFARLFSITKDVIKSQNELKLAMDLSAYSGRSLEEATDALVRVHAGGTKILKEFGIEVKEGTTAAQALQLVQDKVANSAETMAQTTAVKLKILNENWNNLKETVGAVLINAITPLLTKLVEFVNSDKFQDWLKKSGEYAQYLVNLMTVEMPNAFREAAKAVDDFWEKAKRNEVLIAIWDSIKEAVSLVWDSIKNSLLPAIQELWNTLQPFMPQIKEFGEILAKVFGVILLGALLVVIKALGGILAVAVEVFAKLVELGTWIAGKFIKYWEDLTTSLSKVINFFQQIIDLAKKAKDAVSGYFNSGASLNPLSSSFKLPGFAEGGVVTRPTLAMVGEGGEPEAIIPFSKLGGVGGGGVVINVYGDVSGQELVEKVQDAIIGRLNLNGKFSI